MNQPTYFKKLRALCRTMLKCEWYLLDGRNGGTIRAKNRSARESWLICPLTFTEKIARSRKKERQCHQYLEAGVSLGFTGKEALSIAMAADNTGNHPKLRRILLKAARLNAT